MTPFFSFRTFVFMAAMSGVILSSVSYAFASSNAGYPNPAGDGTGGISGYVVSNVEYNPGNDASTIKSVSFSLSAPARSVAIRLTDSQTDWSNCANVTGNDWVCDTRNMPVASANQLQVSASGK
jgi:hypothetical protein